MTTKCRLEEPFHDKTDDTWSIIGYGDEGMFMVHFGNNQREAWKYYFENHSDLPLTCPCCNRPL